MTTGLIAGAGLLLALIGFTIWVFRKGVQNAEGNAAKEGLDHAKQSRKTHEAVRDLSDSNLDDELRDGKR